MASFEAATPHQVADILASYVTKLSNSQKATRDYDLAERLCKVA